MKKNFLIATGGSGGHVIPAKVIFHHLKKKFNVIISSDLRGKKYIGEKHNLEIINTPRVLDNFLLLPIKLSIILLLTIYCIFFIKKKNIDIILSTGGYAPIPLCLASILLNKKLYLFEPNNILGRSNKIFLRFCNKIICYTRKIKNFPKHLKKKSLVISPLVRKEFYNQKKHNSKKFVLGIIGGSQGASVFDENFNNTIYNISKKKKIKIIHQTKIFNVKKLKNFYEFNKIESEVFHFKKKLINDLKKCDLCITRAGASTMAELLLLKIPFLAIPLPSSKDNHQLENALYYKNKNCCWILMENKLNKKKIVDFLKKIILSKNLIEEKKIIITKLTNKFSWKKQNQLLLKEFNAN